MAPSPLGALRPKWSRFLGTTIVVVLSASVLGLSQWTLAPRTVANGYDGTVTNDGPLSFWPTNETAGTTAHDAVGGNNGVYSGGYSLSQSGPTGIGTAAVSFNGTTGHISVPTASNLAVGDGPLTLEAWIKLSAYPASPRTVMCDGMDGACLYIVPTGQLRFTRLNVADIAYSASALSTSRWHHVVATKNGSLMQLFVDGANVTSSVYDSTLAATTGPTTIAASPDMNGTAFWSGAIAKPAIYNKVLTTAQVSTHYAAGITAPATPTPTPSVSSISINNVPCIVTISGVQQSGSCSGTFYPNPTPTPVTTVPSIPTGLAAATANAKVTLTWNASPSSDNIDSYQVYEGDQNLNLNIPSTQRSYTTSVDHTGAALVNGTTYNFRVSAHNAAGYGGWSSAVSAMPLSGGAPANTASPRISGVPTVGNSVNVSNGSWTNSPANFTYQWQDCNAQGTGCSNISGATSRSFTVRGSDMQSAIKAVVTANNSSGSGSASAITGPADVQLNRVQYGGITCVAGGSCSGGSTLSTAQEGGRYQVLDFQRHGPSASTIAALHAANPHVKILMYQQSYQEATTQTTDPITNCVTWNTMSGNNPGWFALNNGSLMPIGSAYYAANVSSPSWQSNCIGNATANAHADGYDGIFWDDVNTGTSWEAQCGCNPTTPPNWTSAVVGEMSTFDSDLHAASPRLFSLANIADLGGGGLTVGVMGSADGSMQEGWMDGGLGTAQQDSGFSQKEEWAAANAASGRYTVLVTQNSSEAGQTYSLGADLLTATGFQSVSTSWNTSTPSGCYGGSTCETFINNEINEALQLGPSTGSSTTSCFSTASQCIKETEGGVTVYVRTFANGIVLVNPSQHATGSFSLGGSYSGYNAAPCTSSRTCGGTVSTVSSATTISLAPDGAAILLKA